MKHLKSDIDECISTTADDQLSDQFCDSTEDEDLPSVVDPDISTQTNGGGGDANYALFLTFCYLDVKDLLSLEGVCRSLNYAVKNDTSLWRNICLGADLSSKITDDILLCLTNRAGGSLRKLHLVRSPLVTDSGLAHVLESNPGITILWVPGCVNLTCDALVSNLKNIARTAKPGLKHLRISGLTNKHIEELMSIRGLNKLKISRCYKKLFLPPIPLQTEWYPCLTSILRNRRFNL